MQPWRPSKRRRATSPISYHDFRKLLERKDLDAVMVATPDHWHALPAIQACQAGKDVFVEKPLAYSIGEGRAMVAAALKHKRITQMGNHIHNDRPTYRRVVEVIRSGALGKIHRVDCSLTTGNTPLGRPADSAPPPELDYEFWLGPAPETPVQSAALSFQLPLFLGLLRRRPDRLLVPLHRRRALGAGPESAEEHLSRGRPLGRGRRRRDSRHA